MFDFPTREKCVEQIQYWRVKAYDAQMIDDYARSKAERNEALEQVKFWEQKLVEVDAAECQQP